MDVILVGIFSSLIASVVYALLAFGIKPKLNVSDKICVTDNQDGSQTFKVKVVNKSIFQIVNVSYHLVYGVNGQDDISYITAIPPKKSPMTTITRKNNKNTDYAIRITYKIQNDEYKCHDNSYFEFTIQGTHPLSGSIICKKVRYKKDDIKYGCTFQTGNNLNILDLRGYSKHSSKLTTA